MQERSLYDAVRELRMYVCNARRRYCKLLVGFRCNNTAVFICYTDGTYRNRGKSWPFSYGLKGSYTCPCHRDITGGMGVLLRSLLTSLDGGEWSSRPGRYTPQLTERKTGWVVERDWKFWRRDNFPALVGILNPEHPACNLVAVPSAVSIYVLVFRIQTYPIYFHPEMWDFRLPPRCRRLFSSSWMLRIVCVGSKQLPAYAA
jgi:hypothetical protein